MTRRVLSPYNPEVETRVNVVSVALRDTLSEIDRYEDLDRVRDARVAQQLAYSVRRLEQEDRASSQDMMLLLMLDTFIESRLDPATEVYCSYRTQLEARQGLMNDAMLYIGLGQGAIDVTQPTLGLSCAALPPDPSVHDGVMQEIANRTNIPVMHTSGTEGSDGYRHVTFSPHMPTA